MNNYALFIDDERLPPDDGKNWVTAKSSKTAINLVEALGYPDFISYDHDLGGDDTSVEFLNWLIEQLVSELDSGKITSKYAVDTITAHYVHSQNPVGKQNIEGKISSFVKAHRQTEDYHVARSVALKDSSV